MLLKFWNAGHHFSHEETLLKYKIRSMVLIASINSIADLVMAYVRWMQGNYMQTIADIIMFFIALGSYGLLYRSKKNYHLVSRVMIGFIMLLTTIAIHTATHSVSRIMWLPTLFVMIFFLRDMKEGSVWTFGYISMVAIVHFFNPHFFAFSSEDFFVLTINLTMISLAMLWYEKIKREGERHAEENMRNREVLIEHLRYLSISQAISSLVHQWKLPLTHIGNIVTMLESTVRHHKADLEKEFTQSLPELKNSVSLMGETASKLLKQYSVKEHQEFFHPKSMIEEKILPIFSSRITAKQISLTLKIDEQTIFSMDENIFTNILMVLIDNAINAFDENNAGKIEIQILQEKDETTVIVLDNAGGIKLQPIEQIFNYDHQRSRKNGHGIGLPLVKMLVEDKLRGDISIQNENGGTKVKIRFQNHDQSSN